MAVLVLYGPPTAGKDTITRALHDLDHRYELFRSLRSGPPSPRYRLLADNAGGGVNVLHQHERYGRHYVVDRQGIDALIGAGKVPVIHVGQVAGVEALCRAFPSSVAALIWCSLPECRRRLADRGDRDAAARLTAWRETADDLAASPGHRFALIVDTETVAPAAAAKLLLGAMDGEHD